jgi:hypothetical protein
VDDTDDDADSEEDADTDAVWLAVSEPVADDDADADADAVRLAVSDPVADDETDEDADRVAVLELLGVGVAVLRWYTTRVQAVVPRPVLEPQRQPLLICSASRCEGGESERAAGQHAATLGSASSNSQHAH